MPKTALPTISAAPLQAGTATPVAGTGAGDAPDTEPADPPAAEPRAPGPNVVKGLLVPAGEAGPAAADGSDPAWSEMVSIEPLLAECRTYLPEADLQRIRNAFRLAEQAHSGQTRSSGEPYITHPISVALICASWQLDGDAICAALMHDVLEDTPVSQTELTQSFGRAVAEMIDGLSKLDKMEFGNREQAQAESFRKMLLAMARNQMAGMKKSFMKSAAVSGRRNSPKQIIYRSVRCRPNLRPTKKLLLRRASRLNSPPNLKDCRNLSRRNRPGSPCLARYCSRLKAKPNANAAPQPEKPLRPHLMWLSAKKNTALKNPMPLCRLSLWKKLPAPCKKPIWPIGTTKKPICAPPSRFPILRPIWRWWN